MRDICICDFCGEMGKMGFGTYSSKLPDKWRVINQKTCCHKCDKVYLKKYAKKEKLIENEYSQKRHTLNLEEKSEIGVLLEEFTNEVKPKIK